MRDLDRRIVYALRDHRRRTGVELDPANLQLVIHPDDWNDFLRFNVSGAAERMFSLPGRRPQYGGIEVITSVSAVEPGLPELQARWTMVI